MFLRPHSLLGVLALQQSLCQRVFFCLFVDFHWTLTGLGRQLWRTLGNNQKRAGLGLEWDWLVIQEKNTRHTEKKLFFIDSQQVHKTHLDSFYFIRGMKMWLKQSYTRTIVSHWKALWLEVTDVSYFLQVRWPEWSTWRWTGWQTWRKACVWRPSGTATSSAAGRPTRRPSTTETSVRSGRSGPSWWRATLRSDLVLNKFSKSSHSVTETVVSLSCTLLSIPRCHVLPFIDAKMTAVELNSFLWWCKLTMILCQKSQYTAHYSVYY